MKDTILELKNVGKTFSGVNVLRNINVCFEKGEVHGILGENGAGKSTLIKIISGYHQPDAGGSITIDGEEVSFKTPKDALEASVSTIYQEPLLCPLMSVADNICLNMQDKLKGVHLKKKDHVRIARDMLTRMGYEDIDPNMKVERLSLAKRQIVEIARGLANNAKVLIMDEPTSSISQHDIDILFQLIGKLRDQGVAIIYISHRLGEIKNLCDKVTVLRDGDQIGTLQKEELEIDAIVKMMVGRSIENAFPKVKADPGDVVLSISGLSTSKFKDVSFDVKSGEIVGISGLLGSGRTEILDALFGRLPVTSGKIVMFGEEYHPSTPKKAIESGLAYVTEDRRGTGLVLCRPVDENINLINFRKYRGLSPVSKKTIQTESENYVKSLDIRLNSIHQLTATLSGGNQQKVVVSKWLTTMPRIVLFDEPTRGIDVKAKTGIYELIGKMVLQGIAVIMVSSELPEILSISDRIIVMSEGTQTAIVNADETSQEQLMRFAMES